MNEPKYVGVRLDWSSCYYEGDNPEIEVAFFATEEEARKWSDYMGVKEIPKSV